MKKSSSQITDYYQKPSVVTSYDRRRFRGKGGAYIHAQEVIPIISLYKKVSEAGHTILELGAGRGRLTQYLAKISESVFCLERSESMISYLKKIIPAQSVLHQSVFDPIKTSQKFNIVTSLRFFEHFSNDDQDKIFINLKPRMAKDAYIIYSGVNSISLEGLLTKFFPYGRYNYYYSQAELKNLFYSHNYSIQARESRFFLPRGVFLYTQNYLALELLKFIDKLGTTLLPGLCAYQVYLIKLS